MCYCPAMPIRNVEKEYVSDSYYHIYNRGVNKADIFLDRRDYLCFLSLFKRYLSKDTLRRRDHFLYPNFHDQIELLAYCLMPNHFHLFIYQNEPDAMEKLMKSLGVAYAMYFNKRYKRAGPLCQQTYKAVRIIDDGQLLHISRYIHMNPEKYQSYEWTSLPYYLGKQHAEWLRTGRLRELFGDNDYHEFLSEYEDQRAELKILKEELADA